MIKEFQRGYRWLSNFIMRVREEIRKEIGR